MYQLPTSKNIFNKVGFIGLVLLTTIFFLLVFNTKIATSFLDLGADTGLKLLQLLVGLINIFVFFLLITINRWVYSVTIPLLTFFCFTASYFESNYGIIINSEVVAAVMTSNVGEALEFISDELIYALLVALISTIILVLLRFNVKTQLSLGLEIFRSRAALALVPVLLIVIIAVTRIYLFPPTYLLKTFPLSVTTIPSNEAVAMGMAQRLWGDSDNLKAFKWSHYGNINYEISNSRHKRRFYLNATIGDFAIRDHFVKWRYNAKGEHLSTEIRWHKLISIFYLEEFQPFFWITSITDYINQLTQQNELLKRLVDIGHFDSSLDLQRAQNLAVVLIIGESARADRFNLNGYDRQTNPKLQNSASIINYSQVRSCSSSTAISVPCMLTRMSEQKLPESYLESREKKVIYKQLVEESSFIKLFKKHGFTTAWLSLNQILSRRNAPISLMAQDAQVRLFHSNIDTSYRNAQDEDLLPILDSFLDKHSGRIMVVLHTRGSHWKYSLRHPIQFNKFQPGCHENTPSKCTREELNNSYDNTILYTDHFLAEVIKRLQNRTALMVYTADHGESLGEAGVYTHSVMSRPEQRHVPMIWWTSDRYNRINQDFFQALHANKNNPASHDNLFHSILDCAGIKSEVVDIKLSLCANL
jgi:glucan phosphoethanolaminetransferase (alkaline phosphatase superfamily)